MWKNILKIIVVFIVAVMGGIFADQILWPYLVEKPLFYQYSLEKNPVYVTETKQTVIQENTALEGAIDKAGKILVGVRTQVATGTFYEGSGLILTSDGLMVTLSDLVPAGANLNFYINNATSTSGFQVLKKDKASDLALIKLKESNLPTAGFADPGDTKLGERVFLVGTIFKNRIPDLVVDEGIVRNFDENSIQTNISEKNNLKGSVLFNIKGEIMGLNTIDAEGKISAIPVSKIKTFTDL